jgi:hypothetical protein
VNAPPQQHEMVHRGTDPSGVEEWRCPACGRHFIIRWLPDFERLVLVPGDETAAHFGSKGDAGIRAVQVSPSSETSAASGEDAWRRWLRDNGIDWDGWVA